MNKMTAPLLGSAALLVLAAQGPNAHEGQLDGRDVVAAEGSASGRSDAPAASNEGLRVRTTARTAAQPTFLGAGGGSTHNHGLRVRSAVHAA